MMDDTLKNKQDHETDLCRGVWEDPELIELSVERTEFNPGPGPADGTGVYS